MKDIKTTKYKGVTITIQLRPLKVRYDFGYKTSNGIVGIGQSSAYQAEQDAMRAIDLLEVERAISD